MVECATQVAGAPRGAPVGERFFLAAILLYALLALALVARLVREFAGPSQRFDTAHVAAADWPAVVAW